MSKNGSVIRTMDDFSKACGISRPTLSKYFYDPESVRPSIRKKIETAQQAHDFNPSFYAVNMNREKTRNIGILVPVLSDPYYAEMVRQFESLCLEAGYWAVVMSSHGDAKLEVKAIQTLLSLRIAGAIVAPIGFQSDVETLRRLKENTPTVLFDASIGDLAPFVGSDNLQSTSLMTDYLCRTGSAPIFMGIPPVNENAHGRRQGYIQQMQKGGFEPRFMQDTTDTWKFEAVGYQLMDEMISREDCRGLTIMCASDRLAFGAMSAAFRRGLRIGRDPEADIRIAGHDDHPLSRYMNPPLTTVAQNYDAIAAHSFSILLRAIKSEDMDALPRVTLVEAAIQMRSSA
ncbi:LacI family DNA-binding transcriptional regulator [Rhizobium sp. Root482]|uniref:LacI family DNA-binding transcriptional regulator n=1 Tax=Rhizobium sp. Root482 TaxID=1736543 RepID=UPI0006FF8F40|nr:LacI family DNA-binding transcriptional regulator [Rhizobium sp. Root482]KQY19136.1 LacI family transcriptional regulator [Rhizobium sp. Root482]